MSFLQFTFNPVGGYQFIQLTSVPDYTIRPGDYLEYDVYIDPAHHLDGRVAFDLSVFGNPSALSPDQNGLPSDGSVDLSLYARGQWYSRKIAVPSGAPWPVGFVFGYWGASRGTLVASFRNIRITDGAGTIRKRIWIDPDPNPTFAWVGGGNSWSEALAAVPTTATFFEENLYVALTGDAEVGAQVASNVWPLRLPDRPSLPALTYQVISNPSENSQEKQPTLTRARLRVNCWAATYGDVLTLKAAVLRVLEGKTAGIANSPMLKDVDTDEEDPNSGIFRRRLEFLIWLNPDA